ncbi:MAG: glycerol-3-phosphate dehydrogenase [Pseudomonadota bacterium]
MDDADLLVIGGGVNGCGVARDAAGRGVKTLLVEQSDLGAATSSASTKLLHGGLRYLEQYDFRLVREALLERETLLRAMPHIAWPMRFVLPHHRALRPAWMLGLGLWLYDSLGGRGLPPSRRLRLREDAAGAPLKPVYTTAFEYSDGWVDDARLVALCARDAADRGARILTRTRLIQARRAEGGGWEATLEDVETGARSGLRARAVVNAGGPWAAEILGARLGQNSGARLRLVRGSHIVTRRLFEHDRAYIFQNGDGRVLFALPYEGDFTLLGTTDLDHQGDPSAARCTDEEVDYICAAASEYFATPVRSADVLWRFAGVRPLLDDGAGAAQAASRDYTLALEGPADAPLLTIWGGKITTFRKLAEAALEQLRPRLPGAGPAWTAQAPLPGGAFDAADLPAMAQALRARHGFLDAAWAQRLLRAYGTDAALLLDGAGHDRDALGQYFGAGLTEREALWMMRQEFARSADDILWRRSKLGLRLSAAEAAALADWCETRAAAAA